MGLKVQNLTKTYNDQIAVNAISFEISTGEIVGFIGPNGSGKSTTMKSICGIIVPDNGQISINGIDIVLSPEKSKEKIGYLAEHNPLYTEMYVIEYLEHIANIYKIRNRKERISTIVELTGLSKEKNKKIGQLSKGYRQRIGIAQAIMHDPEILILDEPTTGLDPNQILEIRELISNLAKDKSVLLSTHILQEVEAICDRVILINKGELLLDNKTSAVGSQNKTGKQVLFVEFKETIDPKIFKNRSSISGYKELTEKTWLIEGKENQDIREDIFTLAKDQKIHILSMQQKESTLEDTFHQLTAE